MKAKSWTIVWNEKIEMSIFSSTTKKKEKNKLYKEKVIGK